MDKRLLTSALDGICNRIPTLPEIPNSVKKNVLCILKEKSYFMLSAPPRPLLTLPFLGIQGHAVHLGPLL